MSVSPAPLSLDGVRVLELARFQAGPRGGMMLSDLGAEVIKIERLGGEETRRNPPVVRGQSVYFTVYNRGKKSICLDLRTPQGKEIFSSLVEKSDIVLENFRPWHHGRDGLWLRGLEGPQTRHHCGLRLGLRTDRAIS